jgi:hypothetical protein
MRAPTAVVAVLVGSALVGCGNDFAPYSRLTSLRVLAIASTPASPAVGETAALSALVYTPPDVDVAEHSWSWCPLPGPSAQGYPCLVDEQDLIDVGVDPNSLPPFDLGSGDRAEFPHSLDPGALAIMCGGAPGVTNLVDCTGGFPVQIKLVVRAGGEEVTAVRTLRLRFADEHQANANPTIDGLFAEVQGTVQPLDDGPGPTLVRRANHPIRIDVPESASESFTGQDDDGNPVVERERLIVSWFVESGDLDDDRTVFIDGVVDLEAALKNLWSPADVADYERGTSDLMVVVRDSRGGVAWRRGTAALEDAR